METVSAASGGDNRTESESPKGDSNPFLPTSTWTLIIVEIKKSWNPVDVGRNGISHPRGARTIGSRRREKGAFIRYSNLKYFIHYQHRSTAVNQPSMLIVNKDEILALRALGCYRWCSFRHSVPLAFGSGKQSPQGISGRLTFRPYGHRYRKIFFSSYHNPMAERLEL